MSDAVTELPWTGERYVPQLKGIIALEHLHRYAMASEFIKGKRVLDIASGEGYGSEMLARRAISVVGVDIDEASVFHAQKKYQKENLIFKQGSCTAIPLPDHSVDVVVSFETIEHINEHEKMFEEIKRVLTPGGLLIISSPEKHEYTEVPKHYNEFHVKELYRDEFEKLLGRFFKQYSVFGQRALYGSGIFSLSTESTFGGVYDFNELPERINRQAAFPRPFYLIALCSDQELPKMESCFCEQDVTEIDSYKQTNLLLKETKQQLDFKKFQLVEKSVVLQQQEIEIQHQAATIASLSAKINELSSIEPAETSLLQGNRTVGEQRHIQILKKIKTRFHKVWSNNAALIRIARSRLFDEEWYLQQNRDVATSGMKPLEHYIIFGEKEGRDPHPLFQSAWYLNVNPDVKATGKNALSHYISSGWKEGRKPNPFFDIEWYLKQNKDVAASGREPLAHYYKMGWKERRAPNENFDVSWYLEQHASSLEQGEEPLSHYIKTEKSKGQGGLEGSFIFSKLLDAISKKNGPKTSFELERLGKCLFAAVTGDVTQGGNALKMIQANIKKEIPTVPREHIDVSIIIPVHNQLAYTLACVASILSVEEQCVYEILIADDASTDQTASVFERLHPSVRLIHQSKNLGFLGNCNEATKQARGDYILFLNNDTLVLPGWLDALVAIFKTRSDAGLVGAKLLNADGTLQEAGGIIWKDGSGWNYGRNDDPEKSEYNYVRETDYCSGACIMIETALWKKLGGFDPLFSPAYYEDTDLAFRIRANGKKVYYQPKAEVIHLEGVSHGRDISTGIKAQQIINQKKFLERWKITLRDHHFSPGKHTFLAPWRLAKNKTILFIDHAIPTPDRDAGSKSVVSHMRFFIKEGFRVILIGDNGRENPLYEERLQQMGIEILPSRNANGIQQWLAKNGGYIDYVFLSRPHTSLRWVAPLRKYTKAKILFYGHDLISRTRERAFRDTGILSHKLLAQEFKRHEKAIHPLVDVIYYPSQVEVDVLSKELKEKEVRKIPLYIFEENLTNNNYDAASRSGLLFVGGFRHPPNLDGILYFINKIFPEVLKNLPDLQLTIVGSDAPEKLLRRRSKNITIQSNISDEHLLDLMNSSKLSIVPLRYGGGIKGKIIDAMKNGLPVLTTPIGAEGLEAENGHIAVSALDEFANKLIDIYSNNAVLNTISKAGVQYIASNFSQEAMKSALKDYISEI